MISRRDHLLIMPWEQKRYENHRRKVQSAGPAIDTNAPLPRQHVALKLKKRQKESERVDEIQRNNFTLLKRMSYIMRTSRVDHYWTTPQPSFLNRISIYNKIVPTFNEVTTPTVEAASTATGRKSKCVACTPQKIQEKISEERVPWEPAKLPVSRLPRSKSVPVRKIDPVPVKKGPKSADQKLKRKVKRPVEAEAPQRIILSRGSLNLAVNFPLDTRIKFQTGTQQRVLLQGVCNCKKAYT